MKATVLLTLAILAGVVSVFLVRQHLDEAKGQQLVVFRTTGPVKAGGTLRGSLQPLTLPAGFFPNILREAPTADMGDYVQGTPLARSIGAGEIVLYRHFDTSLDPGIKALIPAGMKAMTVPCSADTAVGFFIQPGDFVDIIGTMPTDGVMGNKPLVQAVEVLAVGGRYSGSTSLARGSSSYDTITLLLTMEEAQKLSLARDFLGGKLTFLLRSPEDAEERSGIVRELKTNDGSFDLVGNQPQVGN